MIPLVLIYTLGRDIAWLLWGQAAAKAIILPFIYREAGINPLRPIAGFTPRLAHTVRRFFRYGAPMAVWMFASGLLSIGDRYVIQAFSGSDAVGIYSVNYGLVGMAVGLINGPIVTAAFPILMHQWASQDRALARATLARMTDAYLVIGVGLIGGIAVIGKPLVEILLGSAFHPGYVIQIPVVAGSVVWGASTLGHKSMEFSERTPLMVWDALVAAAVNLVLNLILVPRFGYVAAAYTTFVSYLVYSTLIWFQARALVPWDIAIWPTTLSLAA